MWRALREMRGQLLTDWLRRPCAHGRSARTRGVRAQRITGTWEEGRKREGFGVCSNLGLHVEDFSPLASSGSRSSQTGEDRGARGRTERHCCCGRERNARSLGSMERIIRVASSFEEAEAADREDLARLSFEERISEVAELRRIWFGESQVRSRLVRVLESADLASRPLRAGRWPRVCRTRRTKTD